MRTILSLLLFLPLLVGAESWVDIRPAFQQAVLGERSPGLEGFRKLFPSGDAGNIEGRTPAVTPADPKGGPGSRGASIYLGRSISDPAADLEWHQQTWRQHWVAASEELGPVVQRLEARAVGERPTGAGKDGSWPTVCLRRALAASASGDEPLAEAWWQEYEQAIAWAGDLAQWGALLAQNQIDNLDFQQANSELFATMVPAYQGKYRPETHIGRFPGGNSGLYGIWNWLEVERQADLLLAPGDDWAAMVEVESPVAESRAIPPPWRAAWLQIDDRLPEQGQAGWRAAASTAFERSFVIAALDRWQRVDQVDAIAAVLARGVERWGRKPMPVWALLDLVPWRAGDGFAGMEFADRFQPAVTELMPARLPGDPVAAFAAIHAAVNKRYQECKYTGLVLTLRDALARGGMDCIRTTDVLGALVRNAGIPGFINVRQSRAGMGHTVGALHVQPGERREGVAILDGMQSRNKPWVWPDAPPGGGQVGPLVCNELSVRGLDGYVFLEGVIVKGERAGYRLAAAVPYWPGRDKRVEQDLSKGR